MTNNVVSFHPTGSMKFAMAVTLVCVVAISTFYLCTLPAINVAASDDISSYNTHLTKSAGYYIFIPPVLISDSIAKVCLELQTKNKTDVKLDAFLRTEHQVISSTNIHEFKVKRTCFGLHVPSTSHTEGIVQFHGSFDGGNYAIDNNATVTISNTAGVVIQQQFYSCQPQEEFTVYLTVLLNTLLDMVPDVKFEVCANYKNENPYFGVLRANVSRTSSVDNKTEQVMSMQEPLMNSCHSFYMLKYSLCLDYKNWDHLDMLNVTVDVTDYDTQATVSVSHQIKIKCFQSQHFRNYNCKNQETIVGGTNFKMDIQRSDTDKKKDCPVDDEINTENTISSLKGKVILLEKSIAGMEIEMNSMREELRELLLCSILIVTTTMEQEIQQLKDGFQKSETETKINHRIKLGASERHNASQEKFPKLCYSDREDLFSQTKQSHYVVYSWTITDIKKKMANEVFEEKSPLFPLTGYPIEAKAKLYLEGNALYMYVCFVNDNNTEEPLGLKVYPQITNILRNKSGNQYNQDRVVMNSNFYNKIFSCGIHNYARWLMYQHDIAKPPYAIDDSVQIDIVVESPSVALLTCSFDGVMTYKIDNYKHRKAQQAKRWVEYEYSPYFYTSPKGYRMVVYINLRGPFSASIVFLKGPFDSTLPFIFKHRTTITVFNQTDPAAKHLVGSFEGDIPETGLYNIDVAPSNAIENPDFLMNDILVYRVVIEALSND